MRSAGCHLGQGFLFARGAGGDFEALLLGADGRRFARAGDDAAPRRPTRIAHRRRRPPVQRRCASLPDGRDHGSALTGARADKDLSDASLGPDAVDVCVATHSTWARAAVL
jgi:hypothetical protein